MKRPENPPPITFETAASSRDTPLEAVIKLGAAARQASACGCILCGKETVAVGIWRPSDQKQSLVYAPRGTTRAIMYAVCGKHVRDRFRKRVEDAIIRAHRENHPQRN